MRVIFAYLTVVMIWSTTPLAIKWSGEGPGFLFGVTGRMSLGGLCIAAALLTLRRRLPGDRVALLTYLAVALQIYGAMLVVYWAAQFIPSGWISVVLGLSPLITAVLSAACLGERSLTLGKLLAYALGLGGLLLIFGSAWQFGRQSVFGIAGVLLSGFLQSAASVCIKRLDSPVPALSQVAGGLGFALPAYWLTWWLADGEWPQSIPNTALMAIVYLGVVATGVGFVLYYYVLQKLPATRVALITFMTPVFSLALGHIVNHEPLSLRVIAGCALILTALLIHEPFFTARGYQH